MTRKTKPAASRLTFGALRPLAFALCASLFAVGGCTNANNELRLRPDDSSISAESHAALNKLVSTNSAAAALASEAAGILVFPAMIKGGFIIGGFHGNGAMIEDGFTAGYYDSTGASYGLQAGVQTYAYALFFMTDADMRYLNDTAGWEIGVGPSVTVVDQGLASSITTSTLRSGVYCFFFDQKGLMAGLGLQGSKITRIDD